MSSTLLLEEESEDEKIDFVYSRSHGYLCHPSWKRIPHDPIEGPIDLLLDSENMSGESLINKALVTCYFPNIRHVYANNKVIGYPKIAFQKMPC